MTFPNVLVLNYLKQTKQNSPEIQLKAENYISLGYQRLLTFEVTGGGFSLYGRPPATKRPISSEKRVASRWARPTNCCSVMPEERQSCATSSESLLHCGF